MANSIQCPISFLSHRRFKKEVYATSISKPSACKNSPACYLYAASPGPHESSPPVDTWWCHILCVAVFKFKANTVFKSKQHKLCNHMPSQWISYPNPTCSYLFILESPLSDVRPSKVRQHLWLHQGPSRKDLHPPNRWRYWPRSTSLRYPSFTMVDGGNMVKR